VQNFPEIRDLLDVNAGTMMEFLIGNASLAPLFRFSLPALQALFDRLALARAA